MIFDVSSLDQNLLGAEQPFERMVVLYIQLYEKMVESMGEKLEMEDWDGMLLAFDLMLQYLSEIDPKSISKNFNMLRLPYIDMLKESIKEIEERLFND